MLHDDLAQFGFRAIPPMAPRASDHRYRYRRPDGSIARLIEVSHSPLEQINTTFGSKEAVLKPLLEPIAKIRKMSRIAIGGMLQTAVANMPADQAYVNVGVWNGFTFLAGMAGNEDKRCIGIDNFSAFGGPKDAFIERFLDARSASHKFYDQDYREFFAGGLDCEIGVYLYDGEHSFENQYKGLMIADPFYAEDAVIVVDDTNLQTAHDATLKFVEDSRHDWDLLIDQPTSGRKHITVWNGLMAFRRRGKNAIEPLDWSGPELAGEFIEEGPAAKDTSVSIIAPEGQDVEIDYPEAELEIRPAAPEGLGNALDESRGEHVLIVERGGAIDDRTVRGAVERFA